MKQSVILSILFVFFLFSFELPAEVDATIKIKAVGDMVPGTNFPQPLKIQDPRSFLFGKVESYLKGADVLFGNFESTLTNYPNTSKDTSRKMIFAFRTPPSYAKVLKEVGFDILSIANNHSLDFHEQGFEDTQKIFLMSEFVIPVKGNDYVYERERYFRGLDRFFSSEVA